ncbi:MAG: FAD-dependent oxidoreductase [Deinococcales bacterium]
MTRSRSAGAMLAAGPGQVVTTPDRAPARDAYDVVVVGAGLMGAAAAALLRCWAPELRLLLVEADGLPNEGGASVAAPGLLPPTHGGLGDEREASLRWARALVEQTLPDAASARAGWLELVTDPSDAEADHARPLRALATPPVVDAVIALTGVDAEHPAVARQGGWVPADALALRLARRAVREGADLLLNARVRPLGPSRLLLERLALDRRMELGVRARHTIEAGAVVVACGAAGGEVAEAGLDRPVGLPAAFRQYPRVRLETPPEPAALPVVALAGWRFRSAPGGALLVPPALPSDPVGYVPTGGRLLGVPVGLRRELLESLLEEPALASLLASGRLELGKSVRSVRGAHVSAPIDGRPVARSLGQGWWLLAGSGAGLLRDLAAAAGVAASLARGAGGADPPWPPQG